MLDLYINSCVYNNSNLRKEEYELEEDIGGVGGRWECNNILIKHKNYHSDQSQT